MMEMVARGVANHGTDHISRLSSVKREKNAAAVVAHVRCAQAQGNAPPLDPIYFFGGNR